MTTLNLKALQACNMVASKEASRPQLGGVYTHLNDQGYRVYVATNGHALICIAEYVAGKDDEQAAIIPANVIARLKDKHLTTCELSGNQITLGQDVFTFEPIGIAYPDYKRCMTWKEGEVDLIGLDPDSLLTITKAYRLYNDQKLAYPSLNFQDAISPIKITFGNPAFTAILMPVRA